MGIAYVAIKVPQSISFKFPLISKLIIFSKFKFMMAITHLGLIKPPDYHDHDHYLDQQPDDPQEFPTSNYVLLMDGLSPLPIPVPVHELTSLITKKLPVIQYSSLMERFQLQGHEDNGMACAVCLDCIEENQEIRELCNCCHAFHRECIDRCMDEGQVTSPLCRSMLYPPAELSSQGNQWIHG